MKKFVLLTLLSAIPFVSILAQDKATEVKLVADKVQFKYDKAEFTVKAGAKIKLILENPTGAVQPHNVLIVAPGKKDAVGALANQGLSDPNFLKNPVPKSDDVLHASELAQPGKTVTLEFTAPEEAGDYPFMCTYPGHWILMNGIMKVEK